MEDELDETVSIAGMQLRFKRDGEIVTVTRAEDGFWVANVFRLHDSSPSVSPNSRFRDVLGGGDTDRRGAHDRRAIAAYAKKVHKRNA